MASLDALPEEIKSIIISFLDVDPASSSWQTQSPALSLEEASSSPSPLKSLSLVSREWHRLVVEVLFDCLRVNLDPDKAYPPSTHGYGAPQPQNEEPSAFRRTLAARARNFKAWLFRGGGYPRDIEWAYRHSWQDSPPPHAARWIAMLDHVLGAFIPFLRFRLDGNGGGRSINSSKNKNLYRSLSVTTAFELDDGRADYIRDEMHALLASALFWELLLSLLEPHRVSLLAPSSTLACLLNCSVRTQDSWAFPGMRYQSVHMQQQQQHPHPHPHHQPPLTFPHAPRPHPHYTPHKPVQLRLAPADSARPSFSSLLYLRPWSSLAINEGSYLRAYSTYEYFHKSPPGILYPLAQSFEVPAPIAHVQYTAVFPFHAYMAAAVNLMSTGTIRSLRVQLAGGGAAALADREALGKADVTDCWGELEQTYALLFQGAADGDEEAHLVAHSQMERFESGDVEVASVRCLLDGAFEGLGWEKRAEGTWVITEWAMGRRRAVQAGLRSAGE